VALRQVLIAIAAGEARFYPDIYGSDRALDDLLRRPPATAGVAAARPIR
jgi:hypothetical protein